MVSLITLKATKKILARLLGPTKIVFKFGFIELKTTDLATRLILEIFLFLDFTYIIWFDMPNCSIQVNFDLFGPK